MLALLITLLLQLGILQNENEWHQKSQAEQNALKEQFIGDDLVIN